MKSLLIIACLVAVLTAQPNQSGQKDGDEQPEFQSPPTENVRTLCFGFHPEDDSMNANQEACVEAGAGPGANTGGEPAEVTCYLEGI